MYIFKKIYMAAQVTVTLGVQTIVMIVKLKELN